MAGKNNEDILEKDPILQQLRARQRRGLLTKVRNFTRCLLDPDLLATKAFCLFLYGACGALLPYLPLYFKQFGLAPWQVGVILGIGPIIQCLSYPAWAAVANKWRIGKFVFLTGILSWLVKALLILAVHPRAQVCIQTYTNSSSNLTYEHTFHLWRSHLSHAEQKWSIVVPKATIKPPVVSHTTTTSKPTKKNTSSNSNSNSSSKRTIWEDFFDETDEDTKETWPELEDNYDEYKSRRLMEVPINLLLAQAEDVGENVNLKFKNSGSKYDSKLNETVHNSIQIDPTELNNLFLIFMLFFVIGDFLMGPTFTLADASVLNRLEEDHRESPSGMRASGCVGWIVTVLVVGTIIHDSVYVVCGVPRTLYFVAFYFFIGFVCMAFVNSLWFRFTYEDDRGSGEVQQVLSLFANHRDAAFLVCVVYIGMCYGFLSHFLNWYIDDRKGTTLIMGCASAARELITLVFFLVGGSFLPALGHTNVIVLSMLSYAVCFFSYMQLSGSLWVVVVIGVLEGATFASLWRCCERYFAHLGAPLKIGGTTQSLLQALFWGLGNGGGAMAGGALYSKFGAKSTFCAWGVSSLVICVLFLLMCYVDSQLKEADSADENDSKNGST